MQKVITGLLIVVAVIHLLPVSGVLGPQRLYELYGLSFEDPNISILMRHRAFLFGLLGMFLLYAAFRPEFQPMAFVTGFTSVVSFVAIAVSVGGYNDAINKVVIADIAAFVCLLVALLLYYFTHRHS